MFHYASKLLPLLVYPLGLVFLLQILSVVIKRESPWTKYLSIIILVLIFISGNRAISTVVVHSLEKTYAPLAEIPDAEIIVVLGGGTRNQSPPRLSHEVNEAGDRLLYAARLFRLGAAPKILVSGGHSKWVGPESSTEAYAMSDILQLAGVPESAIILEGQSSNTNENAVETVKILEVLNYKKVILVTSALHMPRAMAIFGKYDLQMTAAPTDYFVTDADIKYILNPDLRIQLINILPSAENLYRLTLALKEYLGIFIYRLQGWI